MSSIQTVVWIVYSFLLLGSIPLYRYISFLNYSFTEGHLDGLYFAIMNKAAMNICMQGFAWTYNFITLEYVSKVLLQVTW